MCCPPSQVLTTRHLLVFALAFLTCVALSEQQAQPAAPAAAKSAGKTSKVVEVAPEAQLENDIDDIDPFKGVLSTAVG